MGLFDNLKDIHALKKQAEEIQSQLANTLIEGFSSDEKYKVVINGNHEILDLIMSGDDITQGAVKKGVMEAFADARQKLERVMKEKMMAQLG